ncbi:MAG: copper homeostasis protein CutC [Bacteroidales bacterium]|nr:copper homeostasis protein CutC [Bacteroidales bacterium]MCF8403006.1 copper homeostasis protein CutC [Bacteroidales bacterium]
MNKYSLEVCAPNIQSAIAAQKGGAIRIELCDNLYEGGTTPSYATIKQARKELSIKINVMIRPRGGDFLYDKAEFEIMKEDIRVCKDLGADGLVFGILLADGNVDTKRILELVKLANPLPVTFHRAFDLTPDPFCALEDLISCEVNRILTSGQKNTVTEGIKVVRMLVKKAGNRISIMPGSGINVNNIASIRDKSGAREFHLTGRKKEQSKMIYRKEGIYMGGIKEIPEYEIGVTDQEIIRRIISILNN